MRWLVVWCLVAACTPQRPPLKLSRVILYQNGIGYFERTGHFGGERLTLRFSRHEVDDVLKTLTVIDRLGAGVATVDVPAIGDKATSVPIGVSLSAGHVHDVLVSYAIPTPSWQAAYRVVLDDKGTSLLQGWAVIDNASQEDWKDINLTLATGAPMSYALDLHTPKYVDRPDVTGKMVSPVIIGAVEGEKVGASAKPVDTDNDGIPDATDKCPNDPETYNGYEDEDGCPDRGRVIVTDTAIEILDMIYFPKNAAAIKKESLPIVDAIAATFKGNPSIQLVEVQGHASDDESNALQLSDNRAAAIRSALVERGVPSARLKTIGYGSTQPIDPKPTEEARAKNRRVAFLILKRATDDDDKPSRKSRQVVDARSVRGSTEAHTKPVEVAGAVRYDLAGPVTVRHGSSTMVSIINKPIDAEDVYLFRPDGNAPGSDKHPFRAVRFVNSSGFTLQPGPIAIFARGTYVGDSLMNHLGVDETAWFPYAIDSSTSVTVETARDEKPVRIVSIHKGEVEAESSGIRRTHYFVAAGRDTAQRMFVRHVKAAGYKATEVPPGTIDQGDALLVPVALSPARDSNLVLEEREARTEQLTILESSDAELGAYVDVSNLPPELTGKLREAVALRRELSALETDIDAAREKQDDIARRAYELRENLKALEKVKNAEDLKRKLVTGIAKAQTESDALTKTITEKTETAAAAKAKLGNAIGELTLDAPKAK